MLSRGNRSRSCVREQTLRDAWCLRRSEAGSEHRTDGGEGDVKRLIASVGRKRGRKASRQPRPHPEPPRVSAHALRRRGSRARLGGRGQEHELLVSRRRVPGPKQSAFTGTWWLPALTRWRQPHGSQAGPAVSPRRPRPATHAGPLRRADAPA